MSTNVQYKIDGTMRVIMIAMAVMLDFFPLVVLAMAVIMMLAALGDSCLAALGSDAGMIGRTYNAVKCGATIIASGGIAIGVVYVSPMLYAGLAFVSKAFAFGLFFVWFYFLGWNMWAFKAKRLTLNITVFIIESLPIVELLPGITIMVWRHITLSRAADKAQAEEAAAKRTATATAQRLRLRHAYQMTPQAAYNYRQTVSVNIQQPEQSARRYPQAAQQKGAPERYTRVGRPEMHSGRSTYSRPADKNSPPEFKLAA